MIDTLEFAPLVATGAAIWAATNTVMTSIKEINERRDTVISGKLGPTKLEKDHRRLIMKTDWVPMAFGLGVLLTGIGLVVILVPQFVNAPSQLLRCATGIIGAGFILSSFGWAISARTEFRAMKESLLKPEVEVTT